MKKTKSLRILLITLVFAGIAAFASAQDVVGSWKKKDEVLTKGNGKTTNTFSMMIKSMPCFANIIYTFSADGKMGEQAPGCAVPLQKQIATTLKNAHWKTTGDKLIVDVSEANALVKHAVYRIQFVGKDEMIWTFIYSENPGVSNISKAKQMQTTYVRS
ncbi:MAG: hypothetical protein ACXVJD_01365 [Mucilaginibacter sp.]